MQNKKLYIILGITILVVGIAAFIGGQFFNQTFSSRGDRIFIAAQELPAWKPDAFGLFVRREDNSIFVGTGGINIDSGTDDEPVYSFEGPVVEVVTTGKTRVYKDVTTFPVFFSSGAIHQQVAEGAIDEIDETQRLTVWGREVSDRIIADVLLYSDLAMSLMDGRTPGIKPLYE
jgi:hypothetical protein